MKLTVTLNEEQRLYVIPCGKGYYSCLGFDVLERRADRLTHELADLGCLVYTPKAAGTLERYEQYEELCAVALEMNQRTGWRSASELTPELVGKEGKRVVVRHQWPSGNEETTRFTVGKSTGYIPCHLQLARRTASGGGAVCLGKILSVQLV